MQQSAILNAQAALRAALEDIAHTNFASSGESPDEESWTMAPDALRFLGRVTAHLRPQHVIEFGFGLSTQTLVSASSGYSPPCCITSVDHDPVFGLAAAQKIEGSEAGRRIRFQFAPLVARECVDRTLPLYYLDPTHFASNRPPDLIVIDGPPTALGGREGVLYQSLDFARAGTLVLLDDADRDQERDALRRWKDNLGSAIEVQHLPGFTRGMAAAIVHTAVPRTELWTHRLHLVAQEITAMVPPGQTLLLVDEDRWGTGEIFGERRRVLFLEAEGMYGGPPSDDEEAIGEIERRRSSGVSFLVIGWPAFWWLDHYAQLACYLRTRFRCAIENERLIVFDLRSPPDR